MMIDLFAWREFVCHNPDCKRQTNERWYSIETSKLLAWLAGWRWKWPKRATSFGCWRDDYCPSCAETRTFKLRNMWQQNGVW